MPVSSAARQWPQDKVRTGFAHDVIAGLTATPKRLPPKYFYDDAGCRLFERITGEPEYYPTRTEIDILRTQARAIVDTFPPSAALVEFGMGTSTKVRILLEAATTLATYVPVDIAADFLRQEADGVARDFPALEVLPVAADFMQAFDLPSAVRGRPLVGFFPGSTIGNLEPHEATTFLQRVGKVLGAGAGLIIGVDLVKDTAVLDAAYNDAAGVTAAFNLNMLTRINRELGANFDLAAFEHHAFFNRGLSRIEMHLASARRQTVRVDGETIEFRAGETIHTENSYKYSIGSFRALARGAGWAPTSTWTDPQNYFAIHALTLEPAASRSS
jgi:dimethylhistidine N-methyltransferase